MSLPLIIVHGGAGNWKDERIPIGLKNVEKAAKAGFVVLLSGKSALDAAEACTQFMESCGELNAGRGAYPNSDGIRELDAMIVDGRNLDFGSVAGITDIENPICVARYIMEKTKYKFFAGQNAKRIYDEMIESGYREEKNPGVVKPKLQSLDGDTVGCIVVDEAGNIATTSSTGGIKKKTPGRVGDSPVFGAGAYANQIAGASATGWGEHIMRVVLSRMVVLDVEQGKIPMEAAKNGMKMFAEKTGSEAGIIVVDKEGNVGYATNAKAMPVAIIQNNLNKMTSTICER